MMNRRSQFGFTLVEIAIVLLIVSIILGYTVAMVPVQQELKQYRQAEAEMDRIIESIYAFSQVNGYLPCPAWADNLAAPLVTSDGFECREDGGALDCNGADPAVDSCDVWYGYVPGKTLGIVGKYSTVNGLLLDPWGQPYRYQVTDSDDEDTDGDDLREGDGTPDMVIQGGLQATVNSSIVSGGTIANNFGLLSPDLVICNTDPTPLAAGVADVACVDASETVFGAAAIPCTNPNQQCSPVVILSTGKDIGNVAANNWIQLENLDNGVNDRVFVKSTQADAAGTQYDDLVKWVSPNVLYSKMIKAGQLP